MTLPSEIEMPGYGTLDTYIWRSDNRMKELEARVTLQAGEIDLLKHDLANTQRASVETIAKVEMLDARLTARADRGSAAHPAPGRFERPCFSYAGIAFQDCDGCPHVGQSLGSWETCQDGGKSTHLAAYRGPASAKFERSCFLANGTVVKCIGNYSCESRVRADERGRVAKKLRGNANPHVQAVAEIVLAMPDRVTP